METRCVLVCEKESEVTLSPSIGKNRVLAVVKADPHEWLKPGAWAFKTKGRSYPQSAEVFALPSWASGPRVELRSASILALIS
jgi:hypothetical protein